MKKVITSLLLGLLIAGFLYVPAGPARALSVRLVIIVAKGSHVTDLTRNELRRLFMSESVVISGAKLIPFNYGPGTPERAAFDRTVLGLSPEEVGRLWIDRRIRGQLPAPRSLPSAVYMNKVVEMFPNALGYVPENQLSAKVQPVRLDGLSYRDPNYDLHAP